MAFLFKSKKNQNQNSGGLPPAARSIHTSEGTTSTSASTLTNGSKDREKDGGATQSPTPPNSSLNNSLNSVSAGPGSPDQPRFRQRAESESQVSNDDPFPRKTKPRYSIAWFCRPAMSADNYAWLLPSLAPRSTDVNIGSTLSTGLEWNFLSQFFEHGSLPLVGSST